MVTEEEVPKLEELKLAEAIFFIDLDYTLVDFNHEVALQDYNQEALRFLKSRDQARYLTKLKIDFLN